MEEETKKKVTQSAMKAAAKYKKKTYDSMEIRVAKGEREKIADHAAKKGLSVNAYVRQVVYADMGIVDPLNASNPAKKSKADKTTVQAKKAENGANSGASEEPVILPDDVPEEYRDLYIRYKRQYAEYIGQKKQQDIERYGKPWTEYEPFDFWAYKRAVENQHEYLESLVLGGVMTREEAAKRDML